MNVVILLSLVLSWCFSYTIAQDPASLDDLIPKKYFNIPVQDENPSSLFPPLTDGGLQPGFKYSWAESQRQVNSAGWVRLTTVLDLPISKDISSAQARVYKGNYAGLHWHVSSEWGYVVYGNARLQSVNQHGQSFVTDVQAGDMWLFPSGVAHAIHALGPDGVYVIEVFNQGTGYDTNIFVMADWMTHVPPSVLAKNFQVPQSTFKNVPNMFSILSPGQVTQTSVATDRAQTSRGTGGVPQSFAFYSSTMKSNITRTGGNVKIVDKNNFPATTMASAIVTLKPGGLRELHWNPNSDEWLYFIEGQARVGIFFGFSQARTMNFQGGDIGYVPQSLGHYIENTGDVDVVFVELFVSPYFESVSLSEWLAHSPTNFADQNIRTGVNFLESLPKIEPGIRPL